MCGVQDAAPQWHSAAAGPSAAPLQYFCQVSKGREWPLEWTPQYRVSHADAEWVVLMQGGSC